MLFAEETLVHLVLSLASLFFSLAFYTYKTVSLYIDTNRHATPTDFAISYTPYLAGFLSCIIWLKYGLMIEDQTTIIVNTVGTVLFATSNLIYLYYSYDQTAIEKRLIACLCGIYLFLLLVNLDLLSGERWVGPLASLLSILMSCSPIFDALAGKVHQRFLKRQNDSHYLNLPQPALSGGQMNAPVVLLREIHHQRLRESGISGSMSSLSYHIDNGVASNGSRRPELPPLLPPERWKSSSTSVNVSVISFLGSISWTLYGVLLHDHNIMIPNAIATGLSIIQMVMLRRPKMAPHSPFVQLHA